MTDLIEVKLKKERNYKRQFFYFLKMLFLAIPGPAHLNSQLGHPLYIIL